MLSLWNSPLWEVRKWIFCYNHSLTAKGGKGCLPDVFSAHFLSWETAISAHRRHVFIHKSMVTGAEKEYRICRIGLSPRSLHLHPSCAAKNYRPGTLWVSRAGGGARRRSRGLLTLAIPVKGTRCSPLRLMSVYCEITSEWQIGWIFLLLSS